MHLKKTLFLILISIFMSACSNKNSVNLISLSQPILSEGYLSNTMDEAISLRNIEEMPENVNFLYYNVVTKDFYREAIERSLQTMNLKPANLTTERYFLDVTYEKVEATDIIGFTTSGLAKFNYKLTDKTSNKVVFDESYETQFHSSIGATEIFSALALGSAFNLDQQSNSKLDTSINMLIKEGKNIPDIGSGRGPADAHLRVVYAMNQAIALNIRKALLDISNFHIGA